MGDRQKELKEQPNGRKQHSTETELIQHNKAHIKGEFNKKPFNYRRSLGLGLVYSYCTNVR